MNKFFVGMAKVTFIDIDEQNAEIRFRISDALDVWIDLAKSKNFDVKTAEQKVIHMRSSTGDYTLANFIEELLRLPGRDADNSAL